MPYELSHRAKLKYNDKTLESLITPELRAMGLKFTDPLNLNFKLMIDYTKPYGLFADEKKYVDSALAYLNRIGETVRYDLLKIWIENFKTFIKTYDFLILTCEGVDTIINAKPQDAFTENDKISFSIRETIDMKFQALLTQYRSIWYDNNRGCEVLPGNLRKFDVSILIYSAGYYNMMLYDVIEQNGLSDDDIETKILPTIKKLSDKYFIANNSESYNFNHHLIVLGDAEINNEESGKSFFGELSNEMSGDFVKNNLTLGYRFAGYKGTFNNIFGEFDIVKLLAVSAAQDRLINSSKVTLKDRLKKAGKDFGSIGSDVLDQLKRKPNQYFKGLTSDNSFIGNAFQTVTSSERISSMAKQGITKMMTNVENKYVYSTLTNLNNLVSSNFSDEFNKAYSKYFDKNNASQNQKYQPTISNSTTKNKPNSNITIDSTNIYNRKSF